MARLAPQRGVALVLTLLVVAMLTVVVVSFNAVTRTEQAAARNYTKNSISTRIASIAEGQAMLLLQGVLTNTNAPLITQPGRAIYWEPSGNQREVRLSSASLGGAGGFAELNFNVSGTNNTESFNWNAISTNRSAGYFSAPWIDVYNSSNQIQGRYAFWIDDNGSRLNLNYASTNVRGNPAFYPTNNRPLNAMDMIFGTNAASSTANRTIFNDASRGFGAAIAHNALPTMTTNRSPATPTWGYFFLPEQIRSFGATNPANNSDRNRSNAQALFNALQWQVGAGPGNLTNTNTAPNLLGRQQLAPGFLGQTASTAAVDNFITRQIDTPSTRERFGGQTFGEKYTTNVLRQILANINDFPLGSAGNAFGANLLDPDENVPRSFAALRPFPHLNEVAVRPYFAVAPDGGRIEVQVYLGVELINPYPADLGRNARLYFDLERFDYTGSYERDGVTNTFSGGTNPWPRDGIFLATPIVLSNAVTNRSYATNALFYRWEWSVNTPPASPASTAMSNINISVNLQVRTVQLSESADPASIRDWAISSDLPVWSFALGSAQAGTSNNQFFGFGQTGPLPVLPGAVTVTDALARGVAKNDPRVRTFPDWRNTLNVAAWQAVGGGGPPITFGTNNSVVNFRAATGTPRNLPNDDGPTNNNTVLQNPSFGTVDRSLPTSWLSAFELGQIHTGLQWRTLHLHSQKTNEIGVIPDWAFLDVFALTNAYVPVTVRPNVNSLPFPAMQQNLQTDNAVSQGLVRVGTYSGFLGGFVAANSPLNAQVLVDGRLTNAGLINTPSATYTTNEARTIGTNLAINRFTTTNNWATRRQGLPGFPAAALGTLAEVVEIAGVSDGNGLSKAEKEQRARVLYESLSTYSDTFTIHAVGQALERLPNGQIDVLSEVRTRTQVRFDPVSGRVVPVVRVPVVAPDS